MPTDMTLNMKNLKLSSTSKRRNNMNSLLHFAETYVIIHPVPNDDFYEKEQMRDVLRVASIIEAALGLCSGGTYGTVIRYSSIS